MTVDESWEKIERWLARYAPEDKLPGPASPDDIARLSDQIGVRLPPDVEQSLLRHNGSGFVTIVPPGVVLYGVDEIAREIARSKGRFTKGEESVYVPIGNIGSWEEIVDTRTGRIGSYDPEQGCFWEDDPLWASFSTVLAFVADVLDSPPPWIAMLPGEEEWEATYQDAVFPGTLSWTEELDGPVVWDMDSLARQFGPLGGNNGNGNGS
ncbi:SMI1/KNR4 family protein [Streptomyces sp. CA-288835]|uniref:SMI1/KNR4 family protein n=1 Tax=Streptomyces sp. CA-288835 TaxID=3240069 RepID=UPI003D8EC845